jgi:hypothetical protein
MSKRISINKEVLGSYTEAQLLQWSHDNALTEAELNEVREELGKAPVKKRRKNLAETDSPEV